MQGKGHQWNVNFLQGKVSREKSTRVNSAKPLAIIDTVERGKNIGLESADSTDHMYI